MVMPRLKRGKPRCWGYWAARYYRRFGSNSGRGGKELGTNSEVLRAAMFLMTCIDPYKDLWSGIFGKNVIDSNASFLFV